MSLNRTPPFDPFRRAIDDVFDNMEQDFLVPWGMASRFPIIGFPSTRNVPPITRGVRGNDFGMHLDFHETGKGFELIADLPGMRKEDIRVDVDNESGVLTVTGERKQEKEQKSDGEDGGRKYHFVERSYGKTTRSVRLPETADTSKANAAYTDGVLTLNFPKREPPAHRRLQIPVGDGAQGDEGTVSIEEGKPAVGDMES